MKNVNTKTGVVFITALALASAAFLSSTLLLSSPASATCTTDANTGVVTCTESASATVRVAEACTMVSTVNTPHVAELTNGLYSGGIAEYTNGIGKTTMKVTCNDASGFSVYAIGYTGNEYGNNKLMTNVSDSNAPIINTGTNDSGSTSSWSMKVTPVTGTYQVTSDNSFNNYHNVPTTYTRVAYRTSGTDVGNNNPEGSSLEATYAAYISPTQPSGTYQGQVKYTLVHPNTNTPQDGPQVSPSNKICYYPNTNIYEGTMGCQTIPASGTTDGVSPTSATLLATNFSKDGYGFAGWSNKYNYETNPDAHFYGPSEDITFTEGQYTGTDKGLSLYAIWIPSAGYLQNSTTVASLCDSTNGSLITAPTDGTANLNSVSALTDQRDGETYAIAKLADGKCWMIENLRLESTAAHNSDGTLAQGYGTSATYGNFSGLANPEAPWTDNSTTANSLYSIDGANDTINIGTSNARNRFPRYNNVNHPTYASDRPQNPATNSATNNTSNASMYSYGNYYTWHAAIADTTPYSSGDHNTTSICPTGWQIPLGNTSTGDIEQGEADTANKVGGFSYLNRKMGGTGANQSTSADSLRWRKYPVNLVYSGYVNSGSVLNRGLVGSYWSSTAYSSNIAYFLDLGSSYFYPGTSGNSKYLGWAIRCVAPGA